MIIRKYLGNIFATLPQNWMINYQPTCELKETCYPLSACTKLISEGQFHRTQSLLHRNKDIYKYPTNKHYKVTPIMKVTPNFLVILALVNTVAC